MYDQYANDIFRFLLVHVKSVQIAEDLTADAFLKAWKNIDTFDFKHSRAWLYKIAQNVMTDYWRKHKTVPLDEDLEIPDDKPSQEEVMDKKLQALRTARAVAKLPVDMKSVVTLRFFQGYSAKQTAEALGMTEANVRVVQHRALKKLHKVLS